MGQSSGSLQYWPGSHLLVVVVLTGLSVSQMLLGACALTPTNAPLRVYPSPVRTRGSDSARMVFVPAGEYLMGSSHADPKASDDERPAHAVSLAAFWIDSTEITNARYVVFLNDRGRHESACSGHSCIETQAEDKYSHIKYQLGRYLAEPGFEAHPATEVSWYGALAYCDWAGARLPTEAEWEKAARGTDGRIYPWGDAPPSCDKAQFGECGGSTVAVGSASAGASPYGALDMAGNVWEWVADWYDPAYYRSSPQENPGGPDTGVRKVFRGGSWGYPPAFLRSTDRARNRPTYTGFNVGFRCASSVQPK